MMSAVQSSSSNSGLDASVPVGDLAEDIPLRDRRLAKFLYSFREYNSHNVQLFSEEVFKDHLRAADLFSFDHLKMVLTDLSTTNNFKELFVNFLNGEYFEWKHYSGLVQRTLSSHSTPDHCVYDFIIVGVQRAASRRPLG